MKHVSPKSDGFTLIELLVVISIIMILAGLTISTAKFAQNKAARDRAKVEISALSLGLESYKIDNGDYPRDTAGKTDVLDAVAQVAKSANAPATVNTDAVVVAGGNTDYMLSSLVMYTELSGDVDPATPRKYGATVNGVKRPVYYAFKPNMLYPPYAVGAAGAVPAVKALIDPFRNVYGYSTLGTAKSGTAGYNPTFDLWSTADMDRQGKTPAAAWITNW